MLRTLPSPDVTTIKNLIYSLSDLFYKYSNIHTQRDFLKITIKYSAIITFFTYYSYLFISVHINLPHSCAVYYYIV